MERRNDVVERVTHCDAYQLWSPLTCCVRASLLQYRGGATGNFIANIQQTLGMTHIVGLVGIPGKVFVSSEDELYNEA